MGRILGAENIPVTVNDFPEGMSLFSLLPFTWEEFYEKAELYGAALISIENFSAYLAVLSDILYYVLVILTVFVLPVTVLFIVVVKLFGKSENNKYDHDSKPLALWKKISKQVFHPVGKFISGMIEFFAEHRVYVVIWLVLAALGVKLVTVLFEALAYYV